MAEAFRTFWKGHLRLALVTIPVRLVSAERSDAAPQFHQIDRQSKQRIRYQKVAPGRGEVKKEDIVMGYEVEPGNYVLFEDEEIDSVRLETRHTIELSQFVAAEQVDLRYFEKPYYVLPDGEVAEEGYRVMRDALARKDRIGIGQLTLRGRENLVALYASGAGMVLTTLRYADELRSAEDAFAGIRAAPPRKDMTEMAEMLIDSRTQDFDPEQFRNHYADAVRELVRSKLSKGEAVPVDESEEARGDAKVLDFMEALKRSVGAGGGKGPAPGEPPKPTKSAPKRKAAPAKSDASRSDASRSGPSKSETSAKSEPAAKSAPAAKPKKRA